MNWPLILEIGVPILILVIGIIVKQWPSDAPTKKWADLIGTIFIALLKDYSKEKDDDGNKVTHDDIKFAKKLRTNPNLRERLGLKRSEDK